MNELDNEPSEVNQREINVETDNKARDINGYDSDDATESAHSPLESETETISKNRYLCQRSDLFSPQDNLSAIPHQFNLNWLS